MPTPSTTRLWVGHSDDLAPEDFGMPDEFWAPRPWIALVGQSEPRKLGLRRVGKQVGAVLANLALPGVKLSQPNQASIRIENVAPEGFNLGNRLLFRDSPSHHDEIVRFFERRRRIATRNIMRKRFGRALIENPSSWATRLLDSYPHIPELPSNGDLWCGRHSSFEDFCVVIPADDEAFLKALLAPFRGTLTVQQISNTRGISVD